MKNEKSKNKQIKIFINLFTIFMAANLFSLPAFSYEDCIIMTKGKLNDIKIQYNDVIDVYPLVTISNKKNTLIIHPLKEGVTKFSVIKNDKEKTIFNVRVTEENTFISPAEGYEILSIDTPPTNSENTFELDEPPVLRKGENSINNNEEIINPNIENRIYDAIKYQNFIDSLEDVPRLRGQEL